MWFIRFMSHFTNHQNLISHPTLIICTLERLPTSYIMPCYTGHYLNTCTNTKKADSKNELNVLVWIKRIPYVGWGQCKCSHLTEVRPPSNVLYGLVSALNYFQQFINYIPEIYQYKTLVRKERSAIHFNNAGSNACSKKIGSINSMNMPTYTRATLH